MRHVDPELGQPLPEKSYGGNCFIYDKERPDDPFHNFWVLMNIMFGFYEICICLPTDSAVICNGHS